MLIELWLFDVLIDFGNLFCVFVWLVEVEFVYWFVIVVCVDYVFVYVNFGVMFVDM